MHYELAEQQTTPEQALSEDREREVLPLIENAWAQIVFQVELFWKKLTFSTETDVRSQDKNHFCYKLLVTVIQQFDTQPYAYT